MRHRGLLLGLVILGLAAATAPTCRPPAGPLQPAPGAPAYQEGLLQPVPHGFVHVAGGNLLVEGVSLELDTRLGPVRVGMLYNSADGRWRFDFETAWDGERFVDPRGAIHDVGALPDGAGLPGTIWRRLDGTRLATRGGLVHAFAAGGRLAAVHWASDAYPRLAYVAQAAAGELRLARIDQCTAPGACEPLFHVMRDAAGRVVRIDDRAGRRAEFTWDAAGALVAARDGLDVARGWAGFRYEYAAGRLASVTSSEGERVVYRYAGGRLVEVEAMGEEHPLHRFSHLPPSGGVWTTRYEDPTGVVTLWRYDGERRLLERENGAGERRAWTWNGRRPLSVTDAAGVVTRWLWSGEALAAEVRPDGNTVSYTWAAGAVNRGDPGRPALLRVEDDLGLIEERTYDPAGRLVRLRNGADEAWHVSWGPEGLVSSRTSPAGLVTSFGGYGTHGHPTQIDTPIGSFAPVYDAVGNLLDGPDFTSGSGPGMGGVVSRTFDEDRNVVSVELVDLDGIDLTRAGSTSTLRIGYRSDGRPTHIRRPLGGDAVFAYDTVGRLVSRSDKASGTPHPPWTDTTWEWDAAGRPTAFERPNGMRQEWDYGPAGRLRVHRILRDGRVEATATRVWSAGRLRSIADTARGGTEQWTYDASGRPFGVTHADGALEVIAYDRRSRPVSTWLVDPARGFQRRLDWTWDAAGRRAATFLDGDPVVERRFRDGRLDRIVYGNGLERSYAYDAATGFLASTRLVDGAGGLRARSSLVPSPGCQLAFLIAVCVESTVESFGPAAATTVEGHVLGDGSLVQGEAGLRVLRSGPVGAGGGPVRAYRMDGLGNVLEESFLGGPPCPSGRLHAYNAEHNRLSETRCGAAVRAYDWDEAGFATRRDGRTLSWDGAGRIRDVEGLATYTWDTQGRLVARATPGGTVRFRFGGRVESDATGRPVGLDLGDARIDLVTGARTYRHLDYRNNVTLLTDDTGQGVAHLSYHAFGVDRVVGTLPENARSFAQGEGAADLILLGHRIYDAEAKRFLAPDPVYPLVNAYAYAQGNPVLLWDPDGREGRVIDLGEVRVLGVPLRESEPAIMSEFTLELQVSANVGYRGIQGPKLYSDGPTVIIPNQNLARFVALRVVHGDRLHALAGFQFYYAMLARHHGTAVRSPHPGSGGGGAGASGSGFGGAPLPGFGCYGGFARDADRPDLGLLLTLAPPLALGWRSRRARRGRSQYAGRGVR